MPVKIQYCSDLHLEFNLNSKWMRKYPLAVKGDILLLAGDIVPFAALDKHNDFFDFVSRSFKATYWIPGNHEYFGSDIGERSGTVNEAIRENVFLVNNTAVTLEDVTLICSILWSHINPADEWAITRAMSDFHVIRNGADKLNITEYNQMHSRCRQFIEQAVVQAASTKKIVITHHIPTFMHYPEKYKGDVLNQAFATELYDFINGSDINYWIYGHHHCNIPEYKIGNTRLLTNQLGYVKYGEHIDFSGGKTFTIE
jgi:predicted phosphohydrolase